MAVSSDAKQSKNAADSQPSKRKASAAGLEGSSRPVKRRASKACQCCRARKVRCNVTEHGAPCTNCRLDEVECIVSESRRKKKWREAAAEGEAQTQVQATTRQAANDSASAGTKLGRKIASRPEVSADASSGLPSPHDLESAIDPHIPHSIYQSTGETLSLNCGLPFGSPTTPAFPMLAPSPISVDSHYFSAVSRFADAVNLPYYIKPLPPRIGPDEIAYLSRKGALSIPSNVLRNELLRAYIEFVHPYMPLLDLYEFVTVIESGNGALGRISLILFQAVMFAGSAFIDMQHLFNAGYSSRKQARKDFFQKTRLLYDFDYESDRISLVQALLLLTYYYETPDDQKDTWHWMGVATSVAHTIGLHRNPERTDMDTKRIKLWKRIWWSTYMRDRLIALGMRRPTRIKAEDYDVPMMTIDDFELAAIPDFVTCVPVECTLARDVEKQRQLAILCIEKAKLCLCISRVLSKQYCVLNNNQGMVNDRTTMMLLPKKLDPETSEVKTCDEELQQWLEDLPPEAQVVDNFIGDPSFDINLALLHLVFYTTLSALHRPQVLPAQPTAAPQTTAAIELLECSRRNVRRAAAAITTIVQALDAANLVRYLPTTGVTVLLPAIIVHLLDIRAPSAETRRASLRGFCQCMAVMGKLRDMYAAADYSTAFLEAAIRKAGIKVSTLAPPSTTATEMHPVTTVEDLVDAGRRLDMASMPPPPHMPHGNHLSPPPDVASPSFALFVSSSEPLMSTAATISTGRTVTDDEVAHRLESFLASASPPDTSDRASEGARSSGRSGSIGGSSTISGTVGGSTLLDDVVHPMKMMASYGGLGLGMDATDAGMVVDDMLHYRNQQSGLQPEGDYHRAFAGAIMPELEQEEFDALLNLDAIVGDPAGNGAAAGWNFDDGGVHGFTVDMDWLGASAAQAKGGVVDEGVPGVVVDA